MNQKILTLYQTYKILDGQTVGWHYITLASYPHLHHIELLLAVPNNALSRNSLNFFMYMHNNFWKRNSGYKTSRKFLSDHNMTEKADKKLTIDTRLQTSVNNSINIECSLAEHARCTCKTGSCWNAMKRASATKKPEWNKSINAQCILTFTALMILQQ